MIELIYFSIEKLWVHIYISYSCIYNFYLFNYSIIINYHNLTDVWDDVSIALSCTYTRTRHCVTCLRNRVPRRISVYPVAFNSRPLTSGAIPKGKKTVVGRRRGVEERLSRLYDAATRVDPEDFLAHDSWTLRSSSRAVRSNQEPII